MGIEGLTLEAPAGSVPCAKTIVVDVVVTLDRGDVAEVECTRHNGRHLGHVDIEAIRPF
jgi:hypothetical protein